MRPVVDDDGDRDDGLWVENDSAEKDANDGGGNDGGGSEGDGMAEERRDDV